MKLETPFDLALYTSVYMQPDSPNKNFQDADAAWTRFRAARPLMYLPDRTPSNEDPINRYRRLWWTNQQLQTFGDIVDGRTRVQLLAQERTLRRWHQSAIHIQRHFRGMCGRLYVLQLRHKLFEHAATIEKSIKLARKLRIQNMAADVIQQAYRRHHTFIIRQQQAAVMLQRSCQQYMKRLRRWRARLTIHRAVRCFLWRLRWQHYKHQVSKLLTAAARQQQLVEATDAFGRLRESILVQRQVNTWASRPEQMQMLLRVRRRRQKLLGRSSKILPPLSSPVEHSMATKTNKLNKSLRRQHHSLPMIHPSKRRE
ncbi:hypothetical protein PHMEG_0005088 [Phytophthora megakarya]|uniref:Uncharacterized protein n=1 Tax=Phytophthora megakarya TaxID=4795 RepID=A0A225WSC4_9STRA|nr:hypothetical protein PHMEG_0005088 [Phytophthora megakarya]